MALAMYETGDKILLWSNNRPTSWLLNRLYEAWNRFFVGRSHGTLMHGSPPNLKNMWSLY